MAYDFQAGTNVIKYSNSASLNDLAPYTYSTWIQKDTSGGSTFGRIISKNEVNISLISVNTFSINFLSGQNYFGRNGANNSLPNSSTTWVNLVQTYDGSNTSYGCRLYKNGVESTPYSYTGENGTRNSDAGANLAIGNRGAGNLDRGFDGRIACVGIWNVILTADEIAALGKGFSPRRIRPQALLFFAPLIREPVDIRQAAAATVSGPTVADHPRVY